MRRKLCHSSQPLHNIHRRHHDHDSSSHRKRKAGNDTVRTSAKISRTKVKTVGRTYRCRRKEDVRYIYSNSTDWVGCGLWACMHSANPCGGVVHALTIWLIINIYKTKQRTWARENPERVGFRGSCPISLSLSLWIVACTLSLSLLYAYIPQSTAQHTQNDKRRWETKNISLCPAAVNLNKLLYVIKEELNFLPYQKY